MESFKQYIASGCRSAVAPELLDEILSRHGWFTAARVARVRLTGEEDWRVNLLMPYRAVPLQMCGSVDVERLLSAPEEDMIDKFLKLDNYRIVAEEGEDVPSDADIRTEAELDDEDDLVSEELAEVYLSQGLKSEAIAIYRKLSLLNPKKSIYFAELIEQIEKQ